MGQVIFAVLAAVPLLFYAITLGRLHSRHDLPYLLPAILLTCLLVVYECLMVSLPHLMADGLGLMLILNVLLCPSWLLFSLSYARKTSFKRFSHLDKGLLFCSCLPLLFVLVLPTSTFYYQTDFTLERVLFLEQSCFFFYLFLVVLLLLAAGNLENTLRSSLHSEQWRVKFALLGAGVILASFVVFFSQGLLHKVIDMNTPPLRNAAICLGVLLMLYAEWRRNSGVVIVSRKLAFRSIAVAVAGLYLVGIGFAREGMRFFGDEFTRHFVFIIFALIVIASLVLLLSQSFRRKASIWVQRNLYDEKYDYQGQWMLFSERLSLATDSRSLINAVLLSFCETFGRVGAFYIPVDPDSPSRVGAGMYYEMPEAVGRPLPEGSPAELLDLPGAPVNIMIPSFSKIDKALRESLRSMHVSLVLPIRAGNESEGILFLGDPIDGKEKYDGEDFELMEAMGRQVGLCARSFRLSDELATAREMEALGRLGSFVLHDLKNQVYALSLLTNNAESFIGDPEFQKDMLETLGNTVANMRILITQLTHLPTAANMRVQRADLHELATKSCGHVPGANVSIRGSHVPVMVDAEQIGKVFTNLCLNAVEAGGDKLIVVDIYEEEGVPVFSIQDQSGGIAEEVFVKGLFKPFNTTKQRGMGIGLYHSRKIVEAHGARILVENRPGTGCTFIVRFEGEQELSAS